MPRRTKAAVCTGLVLAGAVAMVMPIGGAAGPFDKAAKKYHSPYDLAYSPDGGLLAVSDHTAGTLVIIDPGSKKVRREAKLSGRPTGVVWSPDGKRVFVAEQGAGTVAEVDPGKGTVLRRFKVGPRPAGVAVAAKRSLLLVANSGLNCVSVIDLAEGTEKARIPVVRSPLSIALAGDESLAAVGNFLPAGDARDSTHSAAVSLIDLGSLRRTGDVRLPGGASLLRDVAISPDGRWVYAIHTVGRFTLPTTQLERGWVNTNAMSIIDLGTKAPPPAKPQPAPKAAAKDPSATKAPPAADPKQTEQAPRTPALYATCLLDHVSEGAADPWALAVGADGKRLWVSLAGVHQLAAVDLEKLHPLLAGQVAEPLGKTLKELDRYRRAGVQVAWLEIKADPQKRDLLVNDLTAMYVAKALKRTRLGGKGPRGIAVSPDGKQLAVGMYFSGTVLLAEPDTGKVTATISLGESPKVDEVRRGEMIFNDATYCFQHWLSCATCHPAGRADGLNWDLLNDGMGNPKNAKSLLLSHKTPPVMSRGVRASMEVASAAGFRFILFRVPEAKEDKAVQAYLRSLRPDPSPHLVDGKLSQRARRGRKLFESPRTGCGKCHPAPLYTDLKMYDVGTRHELDRVDEFDTPTLIEMWRTAPYLHDGSAATMIDVLTTHNRKDKHGTTSKLSKEEIEDLAEYLLSL